MSNINIITILFVYHIFIFLKISYIQIISKIPICKKFEKFLYTKNLKNSYIQKPNTELQWTAACTS